MSDNDKVDFQSSQYTEMLPSWTIMEDVVEGTLRLRAKQQEYLPQFPKEPAEAYSTRLATATFFNATEKTLNGLVGLMFRKEPKLSDKFSALLLEHYNNIDLQGTVWNVFAKDAAKKAVELGKGYLLVDMPQFDPVGKTAADERAANVRPKWIFYSAKQAVNHRTTIINGKEVLQQITFEECTLEPVGEFGEAEVTRYRTFRLSGGVVEWRLFRKEEDEKNNISFVLEANGTIENIDEIPVVEIPKSRKPFDKRKPYLLDLANLNIKHYQQGSDYDVALHINNLPILWGIGLDNDANVTAIGHSLMFKLSDGGSLQYAEPTGASIGAARQNLEDLKIEMSLLGLSMVAERQAVQRTATESAADDTQENSDLATIQRGIKDAIEQASIFHAKLAKQETAELTVEFFLPDTRTATVEMLRVLSDMEFRSQISKREILTQLKNRFGFEDLDIEATLKDIEAAADAAAERQAKAFNAGVIPEE